MCLGGIDMKFRKPNLQDIKEIEAYKKEFIDSKSSMDGTSILVKVSAEEWLKYNQEMETIETPTLSKALQYGLFDENDRLLGLLQIRLELKGYLLEFGGHIGYCVRPSERRKGYAKLMLQKALSICKDLGLDKVLITSLETNMASSKTIEACGGVYEKTIFDDVNYQANMKRYWIEV